MVAMFNLAFSQNKSINDQISSKEPSISKINEKDIKKAIKNFEKGKKFVEKGKSQDALEKFNKAIELNPNYGEAHYEKGMLLFEQNNME